MKRIRQVSTLYFSIIITLLLFGNTSCKTTSNTRKPVSVVKMTKKSTIGKEVLITIKVLPKGGQIEKASLYVNNTKVKDLESFECSEILPKELLRIGKNSIKVEALKDNGQTGTTRRELILFASKAPEKLGYRVVGSYPHSPEHFTEGLEFNNGLLYESTGENGTSVIYKTKFQRGEIVSATALNKEFFGEGITLLDGKVYQLTYKKQKAFVYDNTTMAQIGNFSFPNKEGWGLTNNGKELIMSDGSSTIYFVDPSTFKEVRRVNVFSNQREYTYLNELEYVNGYIYANIWTTEDIVKIDSKTGEVVAIISLTGLSSSAQMKSKKAIDVMNGIAYNPKDSMLYVTGKYWPLLYKIELTKEDLPVKP
ncbi:glutaminyl-peptide cyclotransferase [Halosquirtibacter xylanolyticus]|uniref:glutaminyl-peptide cyclotransferase n=1 Tax=Halosquirtibacter xylanolyticus TaxID=3374599 RepID=UPI00374A7A4E|nr:glutaminyl-peptide cyclotransferase [Prolixibacteraceae bacterium]